MLKFLVLGCGRQSTTIIHDLLAQGGSSVAVVDRDSAALAAAQARFPDISVYHEDVNDLGRIAPILAGKDVCISAAPQFYNLVLAKAAIEQRVNFCDLGGNTQIVLKELQLDAQAKASGVAVIPDCGLSPGMTNVLAAHVISKLDRVETVEVRVGGLPLTPDPPLNYQIVFSVQGLLNEYLEPATIVEDGQYKRVQSLTGVESVSFDGFPELEAFYTHGGISTLPESYSNRVKNLNAKTVRYQGHAEMLGAILKDPRFKSRTEIGAHLESILPRDGPDVVLLRVTAIGSGKAEVEVVDTADSLNGFSAMMRTTGFSAAIVAGMMAKGRIPAGAHALERVVSTDEFLQELARRNIQVRERITGE